MCSTLLRNATNQISNITLTNAQIDTLRFALTYAARELRNLDDDVTRADAIESLEWSLSSADEIVLAHINTP